jgi:hypothetical protein
MTPDEQIAALAREAGAEPWPFDASPSQVSMALVRVMREPVFAGDMIAVLRNAFIEEPIARAYSPAAVAAMVERAVAAEREDAERYRWLRQRIEAREMETIRGTKRLGLDVRIGCCFFDAPFPLSGNPKYQEKLSQNLDAAIDAAIRARGNPPAPPAG